MDTQQTLRHLLSYRLPWTPHLRRNIYFVHDRLIVAPVHGKRNIEQPFAERHQFVKSERVAHGTTTGGGGRRAEKFVVSHRKQCLGIEVREEQDRRPVRRICGVCGHDQRVKFEDRRLDVPKRLPEFASSPRGDLLTRSRYSSRANPPLILARIALRISSWDEAHVAVNANRYDITWGNSEGLDWVVEIRDARWGAAMMFCRRFIVLSSTTRGGVGVAVATNSETTDILVPWSESESEVLWTGVLWDFLPFVGGDLKTDNGMPLIRSVDNCKYVVNAGGGSNL